jgi:alpha-L-rhamnosidase
VLFPGVPTAVPTVHGFRYVEVEGYPGELAPESFCSVAIYSDIAVTGSFTCSNPLIDQLHLDIPTDCPTRERAGRGLVSAREGYS